MLFQYDDFSPEILSVLFFHWLLNHFQISFYIYKSRALFNYTILCDLVKLSDNEHKFKTSKVHGCLGMLMNAVLDSKSIHVACEMP